MSADMPGAAARTSVCAWVSAQGEALEQAVPEPAGDT
jgi:hypothetical protein